MTKKFFLEIKDSDAFANCANRRRSRILSDKNVVRKKNPLCHNLFARRIVASKATLMLASMLTPLFVGNKCTFAEGVKCPALHTQHLDYFECSLTQNVMNNTTCLALEFVKLLLWALGGLMWPPPDKWTKSLCKCN